MRGAGGVSRCRGQRLGAALEMKVEACCLSLSNSLSYCGESLISKLPQITTWDKSNDWKGLLSSDFDKSCSSTHMLPLTSFYCQVLQVEYLSIEFYSIPSVLLFSFYSYYESPCSD